MSELSRSVTLSRNVTMEDEGKKRPGRQPVYQVGVTTKLSLPEIQQLDRLAAQAGVSRYELVRRTLVEALWLDAAPGDSPSH